MQLWAMLSVVIWLCSCVMQFESKTHISPLLAIESPVAQWLEQPIRSRRVVGSYPIWGLDYFRVPSGSINISVLMCIYHSHIRSHTVLTIKFKYIWVCFNIFDKLVAKFALIRIRFSPPFMKKFKQYLFDDSSKIHLIIQEIFIRWFEQNSFDNARDLSSIFGQRAWQLSLRNGGKTWMGAFGAKPG